MQTISEDHILDGRTLLIVRPVGDGPWPGVVMMHEVFRLDDVMRRTAVKLASLGYVVMAPDLIGEGPWIKCVRLAFRSFDARTGKPFELIETARQQMINRNDCTGQVGAIGFCFGGGFALLMAGQGYQAVSVNYGTIPHDIDVLAADMGPVIASYGGKDRRLSKEVPALRLALEANDVPHDIKVYPEAGHCFMNDGPVGPTLMRAGAPLLSKLIGVGPETEAAADTWERIEAFFGEPPSRLVLEPTLPPGSDVDCMYDGDLYNHSSQQPATRASPLPSSWARGKHVGYSRRRSGSASSPRFLHPDGDRRSRPSGRRGPVAVLYQ